MVNLLKTEFITLKRWKATWISILVVTFISMLMACMNINSKYPSLEGIFEYGYVAFMIMSAITGLFIYRDYSQNTIRNKIVAGHSRFNVYVSKLITVFSTYFITVLLFMTAFLTIGITFGSVEYVEWDKFGQNCVMLLVSVVTLSFFVAMISINIKSALGAMLPIIFLFSIMFISMIALELATLRDNQQVIYFIKTLPLSSLLTLHETSTPEDLFGTIWWGLGLSAAFFGIGYGAFKNSDLK